MKNKKCSCCERVLTIDKFGKNKNYRDGYRYDCKSCVSRKARERYLSKPAYTKKSDTKIDTSLLIKQRLKNKNCVLHFANQMQPIEPKSWNWSR